MGFCTSGSPANSVALKPSGSLIDFAASCGVIGGVTPFSLPELTGGGNSCAEAAAMLRRKNRAGRRMRRNPIVVTAEPSSRRVCGRPDLRSCDLHVEDGLWE